MTSDVGAVLRTAARFRAPARLTLATVDAVATDETETR